MPLVFHESDPIHLKKILTELYVLDFNPSKKNSEKSKESEESEKSEETSLLDSLLNKALEICADALPADSENYLPVFNRPESNEDLLHYVIMDSYMNLRKKIFLADDDGAFHHKSLSAFYKSVRMPDHFEKDQRCANFTNLYHLTEKTAWMKQLPGLDIKKPKEQKRREGQEQKRNPKYDNIKVSKYLDKVLGAILIKIKMNPYHQLKTNDGKTRFKKLNLNSLGKFFMELYNRLLEPTYDGYNFVPDDKVQQAASFYFLDLIFDFDNLMYIAQKLNKLTGSDLGKKYNPNELIDMLYQCILIPDSFSKKHYIDNLFDILSDDREVHCPYKQFREGNFAIATVGKASQKPRNLILSENIGLCREYILYLSKVYLPVLSSCFYVLLMEACKNEDEARTILEDAITETIWVHYEDRLITKELYSVEIEEDDNQDTDENNQDCTKDDSSVPQENNDQNPNESEQESTEDNSDSDRDPNESNQECKKDDSSDKKKSEVEMIPQTKIERNLYILWKKKDQNLLLLYDAVRQNIFADETTYADILNSLSIEGVYTPRMRAEMLDKLIQLKINANQNAPQDPIPYEKSDDEHIGVKGLYWKKRGNLLISF